MTDEKPRPDEQRPRDEKIDEAMEDTFPASDPPANTPVAGSRKAERMQQKGEKDS